MQLISCRNRKIENHFVSSWDGEVFEPFIFSIGISEGKKKVKVCFEQKGEILSLRSGHILCFIVWKDFHWRKEIYNLL